MAICRPDTLSRCASPQSRIAARSVPGMALCPPVSSAAATAPFGPGKAARDPRLDPCPHRREGRRRPPHRQQSRPGPIAKPLAPRPENQEAAGSPRRQDRPAAPVHGAGRGPDQVTRLRPCGICRRRRRRMCRASAAPPSSRGRAERQPAALVAARSTADPRGRRWSRPAAVHRGWLAAGMPGGDREAITEAATIPSAQPASGRRRPSQTASSRQRRRNPDHRRRRLGRQGEIRQHTGTKGDSEPGREARPLAAKWEIHLAARSAGLLGHRGAGQARVKDIPVWNNLP